MRLVATDLDGTLLRSDCTVSPRTLAALDTASRAGALVVVVTGRPPRWVDALGLGGVAHELVLCANGALVYDVNARRVVAARVIEEDAARAVLLGIRAAVPGAAFAGEDPGGIRHERAHRYPSPDRTDRDVGGIDDVVRGGVAKLLVRHPTLDFRTLVARVTDAVGDRALVTWSSDGLVEISAPGVTKAAALADLAADHGLRADDAVAFGDMPNDVPMLRWAGHAVAVANAHPDALAVADEVTASNDDDGVALVLERLFDHAS
ncbi:MAG TPA: HAD family hydrolase [Frankiaceae bacterium]|nr:HAD family hydrolase [Frankiaceae bacterium]